MKHLIRVFKGGDVRSIHHDDYPVEGGVTRRASHVEPGDPARGQDPDKWYADMSPLGHEHKDVVLGGFDRRDDGLAAERQYIEEHFIYECRTERQTAGDRAVRTAVRPGEL